MIKLLEENKVITNDDKSITCTVEINHEPFRNIFVTGRFSGTARLKDGDVSNVLEATRIAEAKMERQFFKYLKRELIKTSETLKKTYDNIVKFTELTDKNLKQVDSHIEDICSRL